jgi:uracil-DNA glycosylase
MDVAIAPSWKEKLKDEFALPYFSNIVNTLKEEKTAGVKIYPAGSQIFNAFSCTPFDKVKVVILGQDPYHGPGQAHGLSFSVPKGVPPPPSLVNIFKEIHEEFGTPVPKHGNLEHWAEQGVLLVNAALTVQAGKPMSHAKIGWHRFTDAVISAVSKEQKNVVFMMWGKFAQTKIPLINAQKHLVLTSAHPSPLSAHNGFFGNGHFKKCNEYLKKHDEEPIDWSLPEP